MAKVYVDNAVNRRLGRVGKPIKVAKAKAKPVAKAKPKTATKQRLDQIRNRNKVLEELKKRQQKPVPKPRSKASLAKRPVPMPRKPKVKPVPKPRPASTLKKEFKPKEGRVYVDNAVNRRLGRVGKPLGKPEKKVAKAKAKPKTLAQLRKEFTLDDQDADTFDEYVKKVRGGKSKGDTKDKGDKGILTKAQQKLPAKLKKEIVKSKKKKQRKDTSRIKSAEFVSEEDMKDDEKLEDLLARKDVPVRMVKKLAKHSKQHTGGITSEHMKTMIKEVKDGASFQEAHNRALAKSDTGADERAKKRKARREALVKKYTPPPKPKVKAKAKPAAKAKPPPKKKKPLTITKASGEKITLKKKAKPASKNEGVAVAPKPKASATRRVKKPVKTTYLGATDVRLSFNELAAEAIANDDYSPATVESIYGKPEPVEPYDPTAPKILTEEELTDLYGAPDDDPFGEKEQARLKGLGGDNITISITDPGGRQRIFDRKKLKPTGVKVKVGKKGRVFPLQREKRPKKATLQELNLPTASLTLPKVKEQIGGGYVKTSNITKQRTFTPAQAESAFIASKLPLTPQKSVEGEYTSVGESKSDYFGDFVIPKVDLGVQGTFTFGGTGRSDLASRERVGTDLLPQDTNRQGFPVRAINLLGDQGRTRGRSGFRAGRPRDQARITSANIPDPKRTGKKTRAELKELELEGGKKAVVKGVRNPFYFEGTTRKKTFPFLLEGQKERQLVGGRKVLYKPTGSGIIEAPKKPVKVPKLPKKPPTTQQFLAGRKLKDLSKDERKEYEKVKKQNQRYFKNVEKYQEALKKVPKSEPKKVPKSLPERGLGTKKFDQKAAVFPQPKKFEVSERAKAAKARRKALLAGEVEKIGKSIPQREYRDRRIKGRQKEITIDVGKEPKLSKARKELLKKGQKLVNPVRIDEPKIKTFLDPERSTQVQRVIPLDTRLERSKDLLETVATDKAQQEQIAQLLGDHANKVQRARDNRYNKLRRGQEITQNEQVVKILNPKKAERAKSAKEVAEAKLLIARAEAKAKADKRIAGKKDTTLSYRGFVGSKKQTGFRPADIVFYDQGGANNDAFFQQGYDHREENLGDFDYGEEFDY
jgi:hypothetical protein